MGDHPNVSPIEYIVHDEPVGRSEANYIVQVDLEPYDFPGQIEQLWLEPIAQRKTFKVACLPFRTYGLALGDEVELDPEGHTITRLVQRSGRRILRIFLDKTLQDSEFSRLRTRLIEAVANRGTASEWSGDRHLAIDISPDESVDYIGEILSPYLDRQVFWEWADSEPFK